MKRLVSMMLVLTATLALTACEETPPEEPTLLIDRTSLGFGQEFNSGTFIGTTGFATLLLKNEGVQDLVISNVSLSAPNTFSFQGPSTTTIELNQSAFIEVRFVPTAVRRDEGTLNIVSNAVNLPNLDVGLSGCGISPTPPSATNHCLRNTDL
ncbi:MAG: hypothetical protein ACKVPX_10470 [Myxococcaceae bacterium]